MDSFGKSLTVEGEGVGGRSWQKDENSEVDFSIRSFSKTGECILEAPGYGWQNSLHYSCSIPYPHWFPHGSPSPSLRYSPKHSNISSNPSPPNSMSMVESLVDTVRQTSRFNEVFIAQEIRTKYKLHIIKPFEPYFYTFNKVLKHHHIISGSHI